MKTKKYIVLLVLISAVLFNACKDSSTDPDDPGTTGNYFMNKNGNYYKYNVEVIDSTGSTSTGTRSSSFQGTKSINSVQYQVQVDTLIYSAFPLPVSSSSYFVVSKDDKGNISAVNYFVDTTGFSAYIPAEYADFISMNENMKLLSLPLTSGSWDVFKLSLSYGITLDIIKVIGLYTGKENITLNLNSGSVTKEAVKIKYTLTLQIPDPSDLLHPQTSEYYAYVWYVDGIGIVKWQGSGAIMGAFTGSGINIYDTSEITQTLIQYNVN